MLNILKSLGTVLLDTAKSTIKIRSIDRDSLQSLIRDNIENHRRLEKDLAILSPDEMKKWFKSYVEPGMASSKLPSKGVYFDYRKKLNMRAKSEEEKRLFGSLITTHRRLGDILENISKNVDKLIENESITLYSVRMSHVAILGILKQSDLMIKFTQYLYTQFARIGAHSTAMIPRQRDEFLLKNYETCANVVNAIYDKSGSYTFLQEVDTLRKKNADLILGADGSFTSFLSFVSASNYTKSFLDNIFTSLSAINIFRISQEVWDDWMHARYLRDKECKEWMEQHVTLIRLDLQEMEKDSPIYQKTVDVIRKYDEKIAQLESKINNYLDE